jgi:hypothetical protein
MADLQPCAHCGATDGRLEQSFYRASDEFAIWSVECLDCGSEIASDTSQVEADEHWNRRAPDPRIARLEADKAELVEALERLVNRGSRNDPLDFLNAERVLVRIKGDTLSLRDGPRAPECAVSPLPTGKHQVDTSMESGPHNCFFCERPMPALDRIQGDDASNGLGGGHE